MSELDQAKAEITVLREALGIEHHLRKMVLDLLEASLNGEFTATIRGGPKDGLEIVAEANRLTAAAYAIRSIT